MYWDLVRLKMTKDEALKMRVEQDEQWEKLVNRKWQELTDDEIMHIARESYMSRDGGDIKFARAIEQALREKNFLGINKVILK